MRKETALWIKKAEEDYAVATGIANRSEPLYDAATFHCQQCAEKYLKALLEELVLPIPRTHDLAKLLALLLPDHASLIPLRRGLLYLKNFAVDFRYPGRRALKRQSAAAIRWAEKVRLEVRTLLGLA